MDFLTLLQPSEWTFWVAIGIGLAILEVLDGSFFLLSLALGCLAPALASALGIKSTSALVGICVAGQLGVFFSIRPFFRRVMDRDIDAMNSDALIGQTALVIQAIQGTQISGYVKIGGEEWRAVGEDDSPLSESTKVEVVGLSGSTVTVKKCIVLGGS